MKKTIEKSQSTREKTEELVLKGYGEVDEEVVEGILRLYSEDRINYSYLNKMCVFDLDLWEYACTLYDEGELEKIIDLIGLKLSRPLVDIKTEGLFFLKEISGVMHEYDYEFLEFECYNNEDWLILKELIQL